MSACRQQYALAQQKAAALSSAPLQQQQQHQQQINLLVQQYQALKIRLTSLRCTLLSYRDKRQFTSSSVLKEINVFQNI